MKKIIILFNLILACVFAGCDKSNVTDENVPDGDCLVTINPVGEINSIESPMTRAISSTNDIYLVQVYQVYNDSESCYAMGFFDNLSDMKLFLKQGLSYKIVIAMIKDAKTLLSSRYNNSQNSINGKSMSNQDSFTFLFCPSDYYVEHQYNRGYGVYSSEEGYYNTENTSKTGNKRTIIKGWHYPLNIYQYNFKKTLLYYETSSSVLKSLSLRSGKEFKFTEISIGNIDGVKYPNCADWFYGEVEDFTPSGRYETLNMDFKRVGFKLKYELSGVTDGEVTVKIYNKNSNDNINRTFFENTSNTSTFTSEPETFAFYDTKSAWQYAENYSEKVFICVVWKRGTGVTQDLGEKSVTIKRNCLNNIKIALGSDDKGAGMNMSTEAEDWSERNSTDITVQ